MMEDIISYIIKNINIYKYELELNRFILEIDCDDTKHTEVFNDIKIITAILEKNKIKYILDKDNYSISISENR